LAAALGRVGIRQPQVRNSRILAHGAGEPVGVRPGLGRGSPVIRLCQQYLAL
jgi:hypothetical protein